jgi:hypothetical protein
MVRISLPTYSKVITDQMLTTEEHHASIAVPISSNSTNSSNLRAPQPHKTSSLIKEVISDQLESIIQAGLGVGDSDSLDSPSVSVNLSIKEAHGEKGTNPGAPTPFAKLVPSCV